MHKKATTKNLVLFFAVVFVFFLSSIATEAVVTRAKYSVDLANDFVVTPGKTEVFLNPGETVTKTISVTNRTNKKTFYKISLEDFVGSDDPRMPVVLLDESEESPFSLKDMVEPEITSFELAFGEKITFPVTITAPMDAPPGGHYGAVVIANRPPDGSDPNNPTSAGGGTKLISRVASLLLVRINGDAKESGMLTDFTVGGPKKIIREKMPEAFNISFKNEGNVHLVPYGTISITNIFGKKVAVLPVDAYFALPQSTRFREVTWVGGPFALGRYTAELSLYRGYGNQTDTKKISYFVFPIKVIIPAVIGLFILIGLIYFVRTRFEFRRK